jgi:soluble lytic murein transglycosylase-like protein
VLLKGYISLDTTPLGGIPPSSGQPTNILPPQNSNTADALLYDTSATNPSSGVSKVGAKNSVAQAQSDLGRVQAISSEFQQVAAQYNLPPALLAAIASRESNVGAALGKHGSSPGYGDKNNGYGMMQIDAKHNGNPANKSTGPTGIANLQQGAQILNSYVDQVRNNHPTWTDAQVLRGATAAYNFGVKNVQTLGGMDRGTTGNNYSADVWARAQYFDQHVFNKP